MRNAPKGLEAQTRWSELEARVLARRDAGDLDGAATAAIEGSRAEIERFLRSMLGEDDAGDAASEFRQGVWKGLATFRGECSLRGWMFSVAAHAAARIRRDPYRRRAEPLPSSSAAAGAAASMSRLFPSGRHEALQQLRAELDDDDAWFIEQRIQYELEFEAIADLLSAEGRPVGSAALRKRWERLVKRLQARARELGLLD